MELPQSRPLGTQGDGKATHDFLSLYSSSTPAPSQGDYLKTHDFLQVGNNANTTREEKKVVDRPPSSASVDHLLPTYNISFFNQRVSKGSLLTAHPRSTSKNDESDSQTGTGFTLWDESAVKKGKTGKENIALQEAGASVVGGQWASLMENPSQSSSYHKHDNIATFSSFSSSQPSSSSQKNQSFMEMITSANNDQEEDDNDEVEFVIKKESSHFKGNLSVKTETNQKPNTLRSKHSATEQRRRSKINDRFQKLREIIPNSDQKRDKASFLLQVVNYIQFLQEKVNSYETSHKAWNHEPSKMMQWDNTATAIRGQQPELASKTAQMQSNVFTFGGTCMTSSPVLPKQQPSITDKTMTSLCTGEKLKDEKLTIESGNINISTAYSQGLLKTLTKALQTSGVDLSQASISVQIDLGKRAKSDIDVPVSLPCPREFGHTTKRLRTS